MIYQPHMEKSDWYNHVQIIMVHVHGKGRQRKVLTHAILNAYIAY